MTDNVPPLWQLKTKAKQYYPHSAHMRAQWLRQTAILYATGKHILLSGTFKGGRT